ncbi:hypothetical protein OEZ85_008805 [Tetradesmus obliquus]|uniref:Uncharacterized protein n=1 Tax=Tetradesmus obliquus TaxID=3088 RepID=A0ABY8TK41_TETOB|nr:hypothetical protein OEZ85_008805 [Tetradesmus obliquus]
MMLRGSPASFARSHQASYLQTGSQLSRCGDVHSRNQRPLLSCTARDRDDICEESQPVDWEDAGSNGAWAADNISTGQLHAGSGYSHRLPWKAYTQMMFMAIEAEADSKQGMQDAYDDCLDPNSDGSSIASSFAMLDGDSSIGNRFRMDIAPTSPLPPSTDFTQHVQKAMEAHGAAEQLRQAAEVESQRFFEAMNAASGTAASRRADWAAHPNNQYDALADVEAAIQQGIQAAADNFVTALRLARRLLSDTQAALANCAAKLRLEMSLTPAGSQERDNQAAALQQLQQLTEATLDDLAAGLTSHFLPRATLSTDEARDWLEELWMLDLPPAVDSGSEEDC